MEFCKTDNAKTDDQSATMRFYRCNVCNMIKLLEITSAIILVFWSTTRLPIAVELLIEFTKQLGALLLSTPSIFLIGNAIVVALVGSFQSSLGSRNDLYDEFVVIQSRGGVLIECGEVEDLGVCSETIDSADLTASAVSADVGEGVVLGVKCYRRDKVGDNCLFECAIEDCGFSDEEGDASE
ncbi:hypothetical protein QQ045_015403 [Rhodiola kirilowii]